MLDAQYFLGVCHLSLQHYQEAVRELSSILEKSQSYKRNIYLLLSIAYKKSGDLNQSVRVLSKAISNFPKYYDAYIYRGKLLVKQRKYDKALQDFNSAISLCPHKALGFVGKADCLRFQGELNESITLYTQSLTKECIVRKQALLKRAITYLDAKQY